MVHLHNGILCGYKTEGILPFVAAWMDLQIIMLSEISQLVDTNTIWSYFYIESNEQNKLKNKIVSGLDTWTRLTAEGKWGEGLDDRRGRE